MVDRAGLQDRLENALGRLLELGGVEIDKPWAGHSEEGWNYLDPMETMTYAPPSFWLSSAAQHLYEIATNCSSIVKDLSALFDAASECRELPEDGLSVFYGSIDDLEFHLFTSHLHTYLIRDALLFRAAGAYSDILKPESREGRPLIPPLDSGPLAQVIIARLELSEDKAHETVDDLITLVRQCRFADMAIESLGSEPDAELGALGHRFADVQFACASLAAVLVHADVSASILGKLVDCAE